MCRVEMYTSFPDPAINPLTAEPSTFGSAAPSTPAMSLKTNLNVDSMAPPPRQPPTSSPAMNAQQPQSTGPWPIESTKDLHLSGSEPRIYPGMISRRQRTNSLRQSSTHESDERANAKRVVGTAAAEAVDEAGEGEEKGK